ncbi:MAG: hypothetical protein MUC54_03840 [Chloroflexi bacterium]|jgi:hypothetical protein|nr:hypothetical protein [Chloroflexota bacterium]
MIRRRQLVALALGAALVLSACEAFDDGSGEPGSSQAPGSTSSAGGQVPTVALDELDSVADGSAARIVGQVEPWADETIDGHQAVRLTDGGQGPGVVAWIPVSADDPPAPNTMAGLPAGFGSDDLLLTTHDGVTVKGGSGAVVALTGTVVRRGGGDGYLDYVTRIEVVEETGGTGTPAPGETGAPATTVTIADFDEAADGAVVRVVGLIRTPLMVSASRYARLNLQDATNPDRSISVYVLVSTASPPLPNTMERLPSSYTAADLLLTADDGSAIRDGDAVALSGTVAKDGGGAAALESVFLIEAAKAPLPKPVTVNFNSIKKQKAGTLVRLTGRLDVGILTSCFGTCTIYLEDPSTGATVPIDVTLGAKNERVPNTMWPLPSDYQRSDLRVVANDKRLVKGGARVRVTGWIEVGTDKKRRIDPVVRIDYVP